MTPEITLERRHITAREAQESLGIPAGTIRGWASKGLLLAVQTDENREQGYRLKDVLDLAASTKRRSRHARPSRRRNGDTA
jgi:DNA-binding transcriptional MerR regulator